MQPKEILFRGKRIDNNHWVEGNLQEGANGRCWIIENTNVFKCHSTEKEDKIAGVLSMFCNEVIPETVGLFTGKTDVDGKNVYPGDIQIDKVNNCVEVCEWSEDDCMFGMSIYSIPEWIGEGGQECYGNDVECTGFELMTMYSSFKIIGNRWDNPELLNPTVCKEK